MFKKILLALAAILLVFVIVVALMPSDFRIARSTTIAAPPEAVFPLVNDFHNWETWSPWAKLDPAAKNTFEGPASGKGAAFSWSGNDQVGVGRMTIIESKPSELILIKLDFVKPFESTANTEYTFKPDGKQNTVVNWTMTGKNNFVGRAICLFMNMDKEVGGSFEKGLASMKAVAEAGQKK